MIYDEPFVSSCSSLQTKGWKEALADYEEQEEPLHNGELPKLLDNEQIICQKVQIGKMEKD